MPSQLKDTRAHVVGELYDTERSYVESLQILVEKYMKPLKTNENNKALIDANLVDEIFHTLPEILQHHESFLCALQDRLSSNLDSSQTVGHVFITTFTNQQIIDTYTAFINNWKNAKQAIKAAIQSKPAFERFLEASLMAREHKNKLTLDALLIMPVQRIPRYELLIKELIKHTPEDHADYGPLVEAQEKIHKLALKIDRAEKEMMHQEQLKDLESLIDGNINLQHPQRGFIRYDLVTILSSSSLNMARKERVLFLICDLLIITSVKKKASRRSNLQSAFANSHNDLSLLEGNKFKLLMKFSIDQVEVRIDNDEIHKIRLKHHKLLQARHREIETDLDILNQIKSISSGLKHVNNDDIRTVTDRLCGQLKDRLIILTQDDLHLNHSQDFHNVPMGQLQDSCNTIPSSQPTASSAVSNSQQQSIIRNSSLSHSSSMGSSQDSNAEIEFIIYNSQPARELIQTASIDIPDPNEPVVIGPTNDQAQLDNFETLVVAFGSPERRHAFLQAFLEIKKQRKQIHGPVVVPKQQQKVFSSSASSRSIEPLKISRFQDQAMIPPLSPHAMKIQHSMHPTATMRHQLSEPHSLSLMNQSSETSKDSTSVPAQGQELIACQNNNTYERTQQAASHPALVCCKSFHPDRIVYPSKSDRSSPRQLNSRLTDELRAVPLNRDNTLDNSDLGQELKSANDQTSKQSLINDHRSLIRSAPRFLSALPLNFLNTHQSSLYLSCSTQTYIETESRQNTSRHQNTSGEFWLCLSNGYASHIALISMIRSDTSLVQNLGLPPSVPRKHRCLMIPILNSGGDICKSLITCAAQVQWPTRLSGCKTSIEVSIKPASPPIKEPFAFDTTSRHNTVPLADLRRAFDVHNQTGLDRFPRSNLSTPSERPTTIGGELKTTRSATPPGGLRVSTKSFRSAKLLRHQASLKTNSIIAKLVGASGRRASNPKKHRQRARSKENNETDIDNTSLEHNDTTNNDAANSLDANSISALTMPGSSKQLMDNSGSNVHRGVVSPLSSISSFNSATNSSMTINSACTSSPNRSSTNLFHSYSASCCDKAFAYHRSCVGDLKADQALRNRSATVPSRAFCDQRRKCPSPSCRRIDSGNEIKVCDLSAGSDVSTRKKDNLSAINSESASALWLGCSDGTIIIMNCLVNDVQSTNCNLCDLNQRNLNCDNVHSEINLGSAINDISNHNDKIVFVSLVNGQLVAFYRNGGRSIDGSQIAWSLDDPRILTVAPANSHSVSRLCLAGDSCLWYSYGREVYVFDIETLALRSNFTVQPGEIGAPFQSQLDSIENMEPISGQSCVWLSFIDIPLIQLYDVNRSSLLLEVNLYEPVNKMLGYGNEIIRQHKISRLKVTSLLNFHNSKENCDTLFIGTSAGLVLYLNLTFEQLENIKTKAGSVSEFRPQVASLRHGHTGQVKFLNIINIDPCYHHKSTSSTDDYDHNNNSNCNQPSVLADEKEAILVCGGTGVDLYGPNDVFKQQILNSDQDNTNHLILWKL